MIGLNIACHAHHNVVDDDFYSRTSKGSTRANRTLALTKVDEALTSRCVVPFTSFAEPDPASKVEGGCVPNAWFAGNKYQPLMFFAGFWTSWKGVRKVRDGEQEYELFGFLTTSPNEIVSPIRQRLCRPS